MKMKTGLKISLISKDYNSTKSLNFSELLYLETLHSNDLNKDSWIEIVETQIASDGNGLGLYKTMSGAYITDKNGLQVGSSPVNLPLL